MSDDFLPLPAPLNSMLLPQGELAARRQRFRILDDPACKDGGVHADVWTPTAEKEYLGAGENAPLVIHIHGGGWILGASYEMSSAEIEYCNSKGFIVVSLEYRMLPHAKMSVMRNDILAGYRWILSELNGKIGSKADVGRIAVMGGSAGGTLTTFLAHDAVAAGLPAPRALLIVVGAVDWSFIIDREALRDDDKLHADEAAVLAQPVETSVSITRITKPRMELGLALVKHGLIVDYMMDGDKRAPIELIKRDFPPTALVVAGSDELLPRKQHDDFYQRLKENDIESTMLVWPEGVHAFTGMAVNGPGSECWETIMQPALDFIIKATRAGNVSNPT